MGMNPLEFLRNQDELLSDIIDYVAKIENLEPPLIQVEDYEGKNDFPALVRSIAVSYTHLTLPTIYSV